MHGVVPRRQEERAAWRYRGASCHAWLGKRTNVSAQSPPKQTPARGANALAKGAKTASCRPLPGRSRRCIGTCGVGRRADALSALRKVAARQTHCGFGFPQPCGHGATGQGGKKCRALPCCGRPSMPPNCIASKHEGLDTQRNAAMHMGHIPILGGATAMSQESSPKRGSAATEVWKTEMRSGRQTHAESPWRNENVSQSLELKVLSAHISRRRPLATSCGAQNLRAPAAPRAPPLGRHASARSGGYCNSRSEL